MIAKQTDAAFDMALDAEQALLGLSLLDNDAFAQARRMVSEDDFCAFHHRLIWEALGKVRDKGRLADAISIRPLLDAEEWPDDAPVADYLAGLTQSAPPARTGKEYARLVADFGGRRQAAARLKAYAEELTSNHDTSLSALSADFITDLNAISRKGVGSAFSNAKQAYESLRTQERAPSLKTGLAPWDAIAPIPRGKLSLLGGYTSMGKSAVGVELARRIAESGHKVDIFSLEMSREDIAARLVSSVMAARTGRVQPASGHAYRAIVNYNALPITAKAMTDEAANHLPDMRIDDSSTLTVDDMIARACEGETPDLMIVDYIQQIDLSNLSSRLRTDQQLGIIAKKLRDFAKTSGTAVILLVQLKRQGEDQETRVPALSDIRDSGLLEQYADSVFFVHRPAYHLERKIDRLRASGQPVERDLLDHFENTKQDLSIVVAKQRMGAIGIVRLWADIGHNYIREIPQT